MSADTFIDTNILIYAHDLDSGDRHAPALSIIRSLWDSQAGMLSTQVLQEFYVNVTRKLRNPLSFSKARGLLAAYQSWQVEINTPQTIMHASEIQERHQLSFWDSMIVASACQGGARMIFSEDLSHGQMIEGITITNPFLSLQGAAG